MKEMKANIVLIFKSRGQEVELVSFTKPKIWEITPMTSRDAQTSHTEKEIKENGINMNSKETWLVSFTHALCYKHWYKEISQNKQSVIVYCIAKHLERILWHKCSKDILTS